MEIWLLLMMSTGTRRWATSRYRKSVEISWKTVNCLLAMLKLTIVKVLYLYVFNTLLSQEIRSLLCSSLCAIESCQHTKKCCLRYRPKWLNARQENAPGIVICVRAFEKEFQSGTEEIILVHLVYNIW